jgi:hypothetical protein
MKRAWEQLKPNERRVVVIIGVVLFVLLNAWFVWPHFGDFHRDVARIHATESKMASYRELIAHKREYQNKIRFLQEGGGTSVLPEDQAIDLMRFYDSRAIDNQVLVQNNSGVRTHTNQFFSEQELTLNVLAREKGLVGFLYSLGSGSSMVRVRNMSMRPDNNHYQINASVTIVASYQKNQPAASSAASSVKVVAAAKPAPAPPPGPKAPSPKPVGPIPAPAPQQHTNRPEPRFLKSAATNKAGH